MNNDIILYAVISGVVGIFIGIILAMLISPKARRFSKMKKELEATKLEMASQKQMIVKHFSHSAELLDNMAKDFRNLYQHMAENSNSILSKVDLQDPTYAIADDTLTDMPKLEPTEVELPPKDYSGNPSGLLKTDSEHKM